MEYANIDIDDHSTIDYAGPTIEFIHVLFSLRAIKKKSILNGFIVNSLIFNYIRGIYPDAKVIYLGGYVTSNKAIFYREGDTVMKIKARVSAKVGPT